MKTRRLLVLGLLPVMMACGGAEAEENEEGDDGEESAEICNYSYDESSTVLTWTAFKTSEKIDVNGTFDAISVQANEADNMWDVLNGATFEIDVTSLNSQDPVRDKKLKNSFFGNMDSTAIISGVVNSINETSANVDITMNGKTLSYDGTVTVEGETITMEVIIDIVDFDGGIAMDSLSVVCAEKHTGPDGENKLWSDVSIAVKTTLLKDCPQ